MMKKSTIPRKKTKNIPYITDSSERRPTHFVFPKKQRKTEQDRNQGRAPREHRVRHKRRLRHPPKQKRGWTRRDGAGGRRRDRNERSPPPPPSNKHSLFSACPSLAACKPNRNFTHRKEKKTSKHTSTKRTRKRKRLFDFGFGFQCEKRAQLTPRRSIEYLVSYTEGEPRAQSM